MNKFRYLLKEGFRNVWVNRLMSIASVGVLFSCLLLIGAALVISFNIEKALGELEKQNVAMVFLTPPEKSEDGTVSKEVQNAYDTRVKQIGAEIKNITNVNSCTFVPKETALKEMLNNFETDVKEYFDVIREDNPLPDSYRVTVKNIGEFKSTVRSIRGIGGVDTIRDRSEITDLLYGIRQGATIACIAIVSILFIISLFIISNTIKITMYSRKLEINIMKAVGATDGFVRTPFIMEGMILGTLSGVLSILTLYYVYQAAIVYMDGETMGFELIPFGQFAALLAFGFVVIGVLAGVFGSMISIRKYLRHDGSEFNAF